MPPFNVFLAPIRSAVTSPLVRGSPVRVIRPATTVATPLSGYQKPSSGMAYLPEKPFVSDEPPSGLRYPVRRPIVVRKVVTVGGYETLDLTAMATLSGHRIVTVVAGGIAYADRTDLTTFAGIIGMTLGAANNGAVVQVRTGGEISEPSWNWQAGGDLFLGASGQITQIAPPESPNTYFLRVGVALDAQTIFLEIEDPILF